MKLRFLLLALLVSFTFAGVSQTTNSITIANYSFESQAVADNNFSTVTPTGWQWIQSGSSVVAVVNPGATDGRGYGASPAGLDATNYCQIFAYGANGGGTLYQDTGVKYQAGTTYKLTVAVGKEAGTFDTNSTLVLYNSSLTPIASAAMTATSLTTNTFVNITLTYSATGGEAAGSGGYGTAGDIIVGFFKAGVAAGSSFFDFDNVRLIAITPPTNAIAIANNSFEVPAVTDGNYTIETPPTNWTYSVAAGSSTFAGVNPNAGSDGRGFTNTSPAGLDGANYAQFFTTGAGTSATLTQDTTVSYVAGTTYKLTVAVGKENGTMAPGGLAFYNSAGTVIASTNISTASVPLGRFTDFTLSYTATGSEGGNGHILIGAYITGAGQYNFFDFDNVRLTKTNLAVAPAITTQPVSQTKIVGNNASFSVTASGTAPLSYQWKAGAVGSGIFTNLVNGGSISGATSNVLTIASVTTASALDYQVIVSNSAGSVTSSPAATLTVIVPPAITTQPASQTANVGNNASFSVVASGTAPLTYQWQAGSGTYTNLVNGGQISGATSSALIITGVTTNWALNYRVIASNAAGSVTSSPAATLTVIVPPAITTQPSPQSVPSGNNASFSVVASGTAPLTYQWQAGSGTYTNLVNGGAISGVASSTLAISPATANWALNYRVIVSNSGGSVTSSPAALTVTAVASTLVDVQFNGAYNFATSTAVSGPVQTGAAFLGTAGDQWNIESFAYYSSPTTVFSAVPLITTAGAASGLTLTVTQPGNPVYTGTYPGSSYGAVDAGTSNLMSSVLETFNYSTYPGYINFSIGGLSAYTNYAFNLVVYAGEQIPQAETIVVTGGATGGNTGNGLLTTSMSRQISAGSGVAYNVCGGILTGGNLTFQVSGAGQNGHLGVNGFQLQLAPNLPPIITANPATQSVYPGQSVTLAASALGATSYQWQAGPVGGPYTNLVNGSQISGVTTSTLTINNVTTNWALTYQLLAINNYGSAVSTPVTLTVLAPLYQWSSPVAFNGQTAGQILTNPPGTVVGAVAFGNSAPVTVYPGGNYAPVVFGMFSDPTVASVTSASGILYGTGAYPAGTGNTTGDTNLNSVLNNFAYNGSPLTIKLINLVPSQTYSVQLFAVDDRSGANSELVNFQNSSSTFAENTNAYVLANFTVPANTNTVTLTENLPNGIGTINALVVRAVSFTPAINFTLQPTNVSPDLGDTVTFSAMATGPAPLVPHWQSGPAGGPYNNLVDNGHITGSGTYKLTITNVTSSDASLQYVLNLTSGTNSVNSQAVGISAFGIGGISIYDAPPGADLNSVIYFVNQNGGGTVQLGAGTYYGTVNMYPNVCLKGAGMGVTTIIGTLTQGQYGYTMSMENLTVQGGVSASSYSQGGYPGAGIFFGAYYPNNSGILSWKNVEVKGENIAMQIINASTVTLLNCNFHDNGLGFSHSIYFTGDYGVSMNNCISSWTYTGDGAHLDFSSNIGVPNTFTQCEFNGAQGIGILNQNYNGSGNDIHIYGCKFQFNGQSGGQGDGIDTDLAGYVQASRLEYNHGYGANVRDSVGLFYDVFNGNSSDLYYSYGPVAYITTGSTPYVYNADQADGVCGPNNTADWVTGLGGANEGAVAFNGSHAVNGSITWSTVSAPSPGSYFLAVTYANGSTNTLAMPMTVNGAYAGTLLFPPTGGATTYRVTGQYANLTSSNNSVTLSVLSPGLGTPTLANLAVYTPSGQTPAIPAAPSAPSGLTGYANTNAPRNDMVTWITLNWNAVPGATCYNIYRNGLPIARAVPSPTFTDKHILGCGASETYQITAVNAGGEGSYSSVTVVSLTAFPLNLSAAAGANSVAVSCSAAPGATSYKVYRSTTSGGPYSLITTTTNTAYTDTSVVTGTKYYYVMTASNGLSESLYSPEASATPYVPYAGSPVLINADFGSGATQTGAAVLGSAGNTWNAVSGNTSTIFNSTGSTVSGVGLNLNAYGLFTDTGGTAMDAATTPLMQDYAFGYSSTPTVTVSITGLTAYAGANYTLVIYAAGDNSGQGANLNVTSGASGGNTGSTLSTTATSRQVSAGAGVAYTTFTGTINGGTLTFTANILSGQSFTDVNGFQLYLTAP